MMKLLRVKKQPLGLTMIVFLLTWQIAQPLQAATFYWDADASVAGNTTAGANLGGTGSWDTTTANWWDTTNLVVWPNTNADQAIISGAFPALGIPTANTITLSSGIVANKLTFVRSGYALTGGTLTLDGTTPTLHANLGESATINSQILGSAGLTKTGGGSVRLGNSGNAYTGVTTISNGSLIISGGGALGADSSAISILTNNNTPLNTNLLGFTGGSLVLDGTAGGFTLSRNVNFEGRGPIGDRGAAIQSLGNNTLSGTLSSAVSPLALSPTATIRNSRINSVNGTLTLSGILNVGGSVGTTFTNLGGVNSAGVGDFSLTGVIAGTGSIEKSGAGMLFLNPSSTSGFSGTVRISASSTGQQSSVRVTQLSVGGTSIFGANTGTTTAAAIDLNGGVLEFRSDSDLNFGALASGKNAYNRAGSTIYTGPAAGGSGINGTTTLGALQHIVSTTGSTATTTFNSRNGFGTTFSSMAVDASTSTSTLTNTLTNNMGGNLIFTGNTTLGDGNTASRPRVLAIGGTGNTVIQGSVIAGTDTGKTLTKSGAGNLTIQGVGTTVAGTISITAGAITVTDFRSLNNNTAAISLGNATTTGGNLIIGGTGVTPTLAGLTTSKTITLNTTSGANSIYANQTGANPVILNGAITKIAAATSGALILGGTSTVDNILNVVIPVETTPSTGGVTKIGAGTWVLNAANTYAGATTIQHGTLKLRANAAASDVIKEAPSNTIVFSANATTNTAGGTLEFRGFSGAATTETLGALTPTAGAATVRLLGNGGLAANLTFTSLGATTAASSVNFVTTGANGGVVTLTGQAATTATNLPGTANFLGHLYINGADFATINGSAQVVAPTYSGTGNFQNAASALVASVHNKLTGSFTNGAATVSSLVTNSQTLTLSGNLVVSTGGILQSGGTATIQSDSSTARLINQTGTAATNVAIRVDQISDVLNLGTATNPVNIGSFTTGGLTKNGAGKLIFFGTNAQTGTTTVNEGTIELNGSIARLAALAGAATVVRQNSSLDFNTAVAFAADPTVAALDGAGTIRNIGAANVTLVQTGAGTWAGSFNQTGSGVLSVSKLGTTGAPIWQGLSNYTGVTTIGGTTGSVTVDFLANGGQNSGIGASSNAASNLVFSGTTAGLIYRGSIIEGALTLGSRSATTDRLFTLSSSGATLTSDVSNNNAMIWSNTGAIVHGTDANRTLTLAGTSTGDNTFNPQLSNSTGFITSLSKTGAGQWNLGNTNNTYTGITTLSEGILALNDNGAFPTNSPLLLAPSSATSVAVFQMSGTFDRNLAATATAGTGTVTFGGATASTTGGVGFAARSNALIVAIGGVGSPTALTWGAGGFVGTGAVQNLVLNSTTALSSVDFRNAINLGTLARTINVLDNGNTGADFATMSGVLSGAGGSILKIGTGVLRFTGASTYTGTTTIEAGTLVVTSLGSSTGGGASSVGAGGVAMDNSNAIVLGNATTTGGILQYVGSGETSDRKIRLRGTTASNQIHADGAGPLILTNVAHDTTETGAKGLFLRGSSAAGNMITSQLSDNGAGVLSVTVDGGATWILTNGTNNYTGTTTASGGALGIGHDTAIPAALTISNGNVFAYGADRTLTNTLNLGNNATSGFIGDYSLTFNGTNNLAAGANNLNLYNSIVTGEALTLNGLLANSLTATRAWAIDGPGETVVNGNFTTTTGFGINITQTGNGILTLGTNGVASNWNQAGNVLDVDRGTLKFSANNAIPTTFGAFATTTSATVPISATTYTVASTAGLVAGQTFTGTNVPAGSQILTIDSPTTFTTTIAPTTEVASGAALSFAASGGLTISPELATTDMATVDLNGTTQTVNALTATTDGTVVIDNTSATAATFRFGANNSAVSFGSGIGTYTVQNTGAGALSLVKLGNTATTFISGITLAYKGITASEGGGVFNIASPVTATTGLRAIEGSTLSLSGGITSPNLITSIEVGGGSILSLLDGAGSLISNLTALNLGNTGTGTVTLNLNVGTGATDTLTLLTGNSATFGNTITFNMTDAGLEQNTTYTLLNLEDGGLTAFGPGKLIQGATPGGFDSFTWNVTNNLVQLTTGGLIVGDLYWRGTTDSTWNANANNWALNKDGTGLPSSIPGQGTRVIFAYDGVGTAALTTTLEQNIKINSLVFEAGATTPSSVTINPGAVATSRLEIAPTSSANGIAITAGGPAVVTISAPLKLGAAQTWNVADSASTLTLSGGLQGAADVIQSGLGKIILSVAADASFNLGLTSDFILNGGTLEIQHVGALGTVANSNRATVAVNSGAAFYYNGTAGTVANALTLGGGTLSAGTGNQTYSGTVNISGNSFINLRDNNSAVTSTAARNITLTGLLSGAGRLTVDSVDTLTAGNAETGTLTINNLANTWNGELVFERGSVDFTSSPATSANAGHTGAVTFNALGRLIYRNLNGETLNRTGALTFAAGSIGEVFVDNISAVLASDYVVNQNGLTTLGSGGTGATARFTVNDAASTLNITGGVVLGGNSSISVDGGDADSLLIISSVISDGGSGYSLAINDDAGAWAVSNDIIRLTGANTFSGGISLAEGTLEFNTVTNAGGAASSLGRGTAINMAGGTLWFIGASNQSTNRAITTTGAATLSANGTGGASITYAGAISVGPTADGTQITLTGAAGSQGSITGGLTQTGDTADMVINGGTWTHATGTSRVGDVLTVTGASTVLNLNSGLFQVRNDFVVTAGATLNLNGTSALSYNTATVSGDATLRATAGGVINLGANNAVVATEFDGLRLGVDTVAGLGTLNMGIFSLSVSEFLLGNRNVGFEGLVNGVGVLTVTGNMDLYRGIINASLASSGSNTMEKFGFETVSLRGDNSGLNATGATIVYEGILELNYTVSNASKLRALSALDMRGGNLLITGNAGVATSQTVGGLTLASGGFSSITVNAGAGQQAVLNLGDITRAINAQDGTIRFVLPSGAQNANNGITTTTALTDGFLGGFATVQDAAGTWFATKTGDNITALVSAVKNDVTTWLSGDHVTDAGAGFTSTLGNSFINSLRFDAAVGSDLNLSATGTLTIASGGILVTSNVGGTPSIVGGNLASGAIASGVPELIIAQDSAQTFVINSGIGGAHALTKSGEGKLLLLGANNYTGYTEIQSGVLQVSGGNAIGDNSLVTLATNRTSTLQLLASETIGRLAGGQRATDGNYGTVIVGAHTLTINQSVGSTTYAGFFTGSGILAMSPRSSSNLNLTNASTGFTGSVVVGGGLFQLSGIGQIDASSFVINKGGNLLIDNNGTTRSGTRILDGATITLNSADGSFSGETTVRGLAIRSDQDTTLDETVGVVTAASGASYVGMTTSGTNDDTDIIVNNLLRTNSATLNVRGTVLGGSDARENEFRIGDTTNRTNFINAMVGGAGPAGTQNISIIPWTIGESVATGLGAGNMGNSLLTYDATTGLRPLNFTTEYDALALAAATDNARESLNADLTGLVGTTVNALVIDSLAFVGLDVTGSGGGQALAVTSGALLFTVSGGAVSTAYDTTLGGFDSGITVGASNEYVIHVVNPSAAVDTSTLTATIASSLTSIADITKSGRGKLILNVSNTAGGGSKKTTINEGLLEITDLDNIGGGTGGLVFAGGTLRFSGTYGGDDISTRTITFLQAGGTLDTNGFNLVLANSLGSGIGSFTKTGTGILTLNGAAGIATYTGATTIADGLLVLNGGVNNRLSPLTELTIGGGTTSGILQLGDAVNGASNLTVASLASAGSGTANAIVGGGAVVSEFTVNQAGITTYAGSFGGAGLNENNLGIVKSGIGTLTLSGNVLNYNGVTNVNAGTLNITGSSASALATTGVTVAAGATLNLINGAGQAVNLGAGVLSLGAGLGTTVLGLELGSTSAYDSFTTSTTATTANQVVFNLTGLTGFGAGNYDLLSAAGGGLAGGTYSIGTLSGSLTGVTLSLNTSATLVQLAAVASTGPIYWNGTINTSWTGMSGINTNFTSDPAGTTNANGTPGTASNVIFTTSTQTGAALNTTLDAVFSIQDLTFNNAVVTGPLAAITIGPGSGGTLTIGAGINVQTGAPAGITISAPVILGASQTWTVADAATVLTSSGGISGTGNLTKAGSGILRVIGTSNYSGTTIVSGGVLAGGAANAFNATSAYTIGAAGTLGVNGFAQTIGSLSGSAGAIVTNGAAAGNVVLTVGDSASTAFAGNIANGGTATLGLTKVGTGTLTLSGTNTYTGVTTINSGGIAITGGSINTGAGNVIVGGNVAGSRGRFDMSGSVAVTTNTFSVGANATGAGAIYQSTNGTVSVTAADTTNIGVTLGAATSGYGYYKLSSGTLNTPRLTTVGNNFVGATGVFEQTGGIMNATTWSVIGHGQGNALVDISGGTYNAGGSFALNHVSSAYSVVNVRGTGTINRTAGSISLMQGNTNSLNNVGIINLLSGGTIRTHSGGIVNGAGTGSSGNVALINFNGGTLVTNAASTALVSITSIGTALTSNSGAYIYSGGLTVDTNGLNSTLPAALLAPAGEGVATMAVSSGGSGYIGAPLIKITGGTGVGATAVANMVDDGTGNGTFSIGSITITNPGTGYVNTDVLTLAFADNTSVYTTQATLGAVTFNGGNTSGGLTKIGAGTLMLTGANTYTGGTTINDGTLAFGAGNVLADTGNVTVNGGILNVATFSDTVATVTLQSGSITGSTGVLTSTTAYDLRDGTASAILAGAVGVNKTTTGTVTLSGANTFNGVVNVTAGTLAFSASNNLGDGTATNTITVNGGTLSHAGAGSVDLGANRVLTIGSTGGTLNASSSTGLLNFSAGVSGASNGNLTKTGAGTVVLAGTTDLNGGAVAVNNGTLRAGFGTDGISALTVGATGIMDFSNGSTQDLAGLTGLTLNGGARLGFELNTLTNDSLAAINAATAAGTIILDFFIVGGGVSATTYNLISAPSGLLGASYSLGTGISGWNLVINSSDTLISLTATPFVPVYWRGGQDFSWNTLGAATANWTTDAAGSPDASQKPQSNNTVIFSATGAPFTSGTQITTTLDATFTIDSLVFDSVPATVSAVTINPGTGGTLALTPVSSSAGIEVKDNAGTITIAAPLTAGAAQTWQVSNTGAALIVSGDTLFTGLVNKTGAGALTLSGSNSGAGGVTLSVGTLNINSATALGAGTFSIAAGTTLDNSSAGGITLTNNNVQNWGGSFTYLGGTQSLNLGTGAVTMPNHTTLMVNGQTLAVGGAIGDSGNNRVLTKAGAGTLVLGGNNNFGGGLTLLGGTLHLNQAGALGTGIFTIEAGTAFDNITGGALALSANNAQVWNGSFTFTGTNSLNLGNGNVLLGNNLTVTTAGGTLTVGGVIDDGASTFGFTKSGAGSLSIGGINTYGGATVLNQGSLIFTANQSLTAGTNTLTLGATAGSTSAFSMDLSTASAIFGGAGLVQTDNAVANTVTIGFGQTLRVNDSFTVGYNSAANSTTTLNITGADGTFTLGAAGAPTNANVQIGNGATTERSNAATLDMSGLGTFYANLGTGTFRVGSPTNAGGTAAAGSTLILAANSTIIATTITSDSPDTSTVTQAIKLGSGTNVLNATTITIGGGANRARGTLDFNGATGTVQIRNLVGTGRAAMNVQNGSASTSANLFGTVDFTGHSADLLLGTLAIGGRSAATTGSGTGSFSFDTGVLDATTVNLAARTGSTSTTGSVTGTMNLGGTTVGTTATIGTVTMSTNSANTATTSGDAISTLNISGIGTNTITTMTMGVLSVSGATNVAGADTSATVNVTGGTTTIGTLTMGANNSTAAAVNGANTATSALNISAGSVSVTNNLTMGSTTLRALNTAAATITITGTGSLTVGGNIQYTNGLGTETNTITLNGGLLDMTAGNIGSAAALIAFNAQSGTLRNLSELNGGGTLNKTTGGTLILDTANNYTGGTTVSAGILDVSHGGALGGSVNGTSVVAGGTLSMSGSITVTGESLSLAAGAGGNVALSNQSGANTWTGNLTVDTGSDASNRALLNSDAGQLTVSGNVNLSSGTQDFVLRGDGNGEISGQITGSQRLFKSSVGAGTWILSGDNSTTFTGRTSVGNGTIQISSESNLGAVPGSFAANQLTLGGGTSNGTLRTTASTSLSANRGVTLGAVGGTFESAATTTLTVNGVIAGTVGALNKTGAGTLVLTAANTYAGTTNVSAGTLQVGNGSTGSLDGTSGVNVTGSGSKLSGSGSIAGSTNLGNGTILAPGVGDTDGSNQMLNFAALEVQSGGQVQLSISNRTEQLGSSELSALTVALNGGSYTTVAALFTTGQLDAYKTTAPGNHDFVNISGTFTVNADNVATPLFKVVNRTSLPYTTAAPSVGDVFNLMDWTTLSYSGTNTSLTEANFDFTGAGFTGEFKFDTSAFATHGILVVVPEPSRAFFILIGLLGLLMRRRRRVL